MDNDDDTSTECGESVWERPEVEKSQGSELREQKSAQRPVTGNTRAGGWTRLREPPPRSAVGREEGRDPQVVPLAPRPHKFARTGASALRSQRGLGEKASDLEHEHRQDSPPAFDEVRVVENGGLV